MMTMMMMIPMMNDSIVYLDLSTSQVSLDRSPPEGREEKSRKTYKRKTSDYKVSAPH